MMTPASLVLTSARRVRKSWGKGDWESEREGGGEEAGGIKDQGRRRKQKREIKTLLTGTGRGRGHCAKINDKR